MSDEKPPFLSLQVEKSSYAFFDLAAVDRGSLGISCSGRELCDKDYTVERDSFNYFAIEFVLAGRCEVSLQEKRFVLGPGELFAYGPDTKHSMRALEGETLLKYFVDFSGSQAEAQLALAGLGQDTPVRAEPVRWIQQIFDQMIDCANYPKADALELGNQLLNLLFLRVRQNTTDATLNSGESSPAYRRCRNYIREHFLEIKTLKEVSVACHLDQAYLSRLFKTYAKESPLHYLSRLKMEYAAGLIVTEGRSIKFAAAEVGYDDPYHFSRAFKRHFGIAPKYFTRRVSSR